jgi:hypothetical protein
MYVGALGVAALALSPAWTAPAQANLVNNGDFTSTSLSSPGGFICAYGSTCTSNVADWGSACGATGPCGTTYTVASLLYRGTNGVAFNGGIGLWSVGDLAGYTGNYIAIDGDPTWTAPLYQTITGLTPGQSYTLTFYQAAAQQLGVGGATTEHWQVSLGGQTLNSTTMSNPSTGFTPWNQQSLGFTATSTSELLNFAAVGTPQGLPPVALLADVSLTSVPEPASWALLLAGFAGLGFAGYRQSRAARKTARA